jgi:lambda family phage minor tail protein L
MPELNLTASELPDLIYLFEIDLTFINVDLQSGVQPRYYFYSAGAKYNTLITTSFMRYNQTVYPDITFYPIAMLLEGMSRDADGKASRPKIKITKLDPVISAIVAGLDRANKDFVGAGITVNAKFATDDLATSSQIYNYDFYYISQKTSENRFIIEFDLMSPFDIEHIKYPKRVVSKGTCIWEYKDPDTCGWVPVRDRYYDYSDAVATIDTDRCGKRLKSCSLRFGTSPLRFGGFPTLED